MTDTNQTAESARPSPAEMQGTLAALRSNLRRVIRGKDDAIDLLLAALLARGHVLIEDMPGLGKTTLAKALARSIDSSFCRIQFTPDLLPTDVLGGSVYNPREGNFDFHKGPIFTNILLADEINRASPRTQSSLLEAMAERQATIEGTRHALEGVFIVMATQNPVEYHGTYPLPEAQLDRFLIRMALGYAEADIELAILRDRQSADPLDDVQPVATADQILAMQDAVCEIHVHDDLARYVVDLVRTTREHEKVQIGVSPRGILGLSRMAQALAFMAGRDHVLPDEIQRAAVPVLAHRILLETKAKYDGTSKLNVIEQIVAKKAVPK